MKRAIEESFPIVEINRLAVPERNAFSLAAQRFISSQYLQFFLL
jgi:hypothetical protein